MHIEPSPEQELPAAQPEVVITPTDAALAGFYADRNLMWRNVRWITFGHFGMALSMTIVEPLMYLRLRAVGVSDSSIGLLTSANLWAVSFLVMYFSWKSDHCTSRMGRRTPFVLLSMPFIAVALVAFPFLSQKGLLIGVMLTYLFFNDMKASTYPLLAIDCVSKEVLARVNGILTVMLGVAGFLSSRIGAQDGGCQPCACLSRRDSGHDGSNAARPMADQGAANLSPRQSRIQLARPRQGGSPRQADSRAHDRRRPAPCLSHDLQDLGVVLRTIETWSFHWRDRRRDVAGLAGADRVLLPGRVADRPFGSYRALCLGWLLMLALVLCSLRVTNAHGLVVLVSLYFLFLPLQVAGDAILWKTIDKADIGSYTSTVSLVRNFSTGTVIALSGFLIKWTGSYIVAFWFGFSLSSVALVVLFVYRHIMRSGSTPLSLPVATIVEAS